MGVDELVVRPSQAKIDADAQLTTIDAMQWRKREPG